MYSLVCLSFSFSFSFYSVLAANSKNTIFNIIQLLSATAMSSHGPSAATAEATRTTTAAKTS